MKEKEVNMMLMMKVKMQNKQNKKRRSVNYPREIGTTNTETPN
jgi:hypothetical protein